MKFPLVGVNFVDVEVGSGGLLDSLPSTLTFTNADVIKGIDRDKLPKVGETIRFRTGDGLFEATVLGHQICDAPGENISIEFDLSPLRKVVE